MSSVAAIAGNGNDKDRFGRDREDKVTSGGLMLTGDLNGLLINNMNGFESRPGIGVGLGGFIDFKVTTHFVIESGLSFGYGHTGISNAEVSGVMKNWTTSIPLFFMAKMPVRDGGGGVFYLGGGPYTEFVVGCRTELGGSVFNPYEQIVGKDDSGEDVFALSNSNSGIAVKFTYELPYHFQIFAAQYYSLSDIIGFNHAKGGIHPYKSQIGIAYRFR